MQACIFDLDGTLLNTLPTVQHYANRTLAHFGLRAIELEQCKEMCRLSIQGFYHKMLELGGCPMAEIGNLADDVRRYDLAMYEQDPLYLTKPYDGISEVLQSLKEKGIRLGVLTNKPDMLAQKLMSVYFPGLIELCAGQTMDTIAKPDPRALWDIIEQMGLTRGQCIYAGDTDVDMLTAQRADVFSIAVTWGYLSREELAAYNPGGFAHAPRDVLGYF